MMMLKPPSAARDTTQTASFIVIGTADAPALEAIEAVGGRLVARLGWSDDVLSPDRYAACSVLLIEAEGADNDTLAAILPRLDAMAAALQLAVIITLDERAIDVVAATMEKSRAQMLCRPTQAERLVALATAAEQRNGYIIGDVTREGEAARLHRLNEEVARIADVLARLTRRDPADRNVGAIVSDHPTPFRQDPATDVAIDPAEVRRAIRARRMRDQHFGSGLFEDPAWDILLDLFAADLEGTQVSVSSLCIAASVAPTTALRWIAKLTDSGLLERHPDAFDRRRAFMELSPNAARAMRSHVAALRRAGLPFG